MISPNPEQVEAVTSLSGLLSYLPEGVSVTSVLIAVIVFLKYVRERDRDAGEQRAEMKELNEAVLEVVKENSTALGRTAEAVSRLEAKLQ